MEITAPAFHRIENINLVTAGFLRRWVASLLDAFILSPLFLWYNLPFMKSMLEEIISLPDIFYQWGWWRAVILAAGMFCYCWLLVGLRGQTIGMSALGIRVTRLDARPVGLGIAALRTLSFFLPSLISSIFYNSIFLGPLISSAAAIGLLWIMVDRAHQGYHDKIANTIVLLNKYYQPRKES